MVPDFYLFLIYFFIKYLLLLSFKLVVNHLTTQSPLLGVVYFTNPLNIGVYMEEHRIDEAIRQQANNYKFIPETISSLKLLVIKRNPNSESSLLDIPTLNAIGGTS